VLEVDESEARWDSGLKHKERLFVLHYCTDDLTFLNATASYKAVYKERNKVTGKVMDRSNEVCEAAASRLLSKEHIKRACSKLLTETQADLDEKNGYKLLKDLMLLAAYNPADIIDKKGKLKVKSIEELGDYAKCISQIEVTQNGVKVTLADRSKYMQMYLKYLNLIRPEVLVAEQLKVVAMVEKDNSIKAWNSRAGGAIESDTGTL
ncbi:MAG: terminase small subunit, partial [Methanobrevibacter sp.]|nr:terminase small subunit [Methanobrevibacter sp.]